MKNIIVLGAGLVGKAIAIDLAKDHEVTAADRDDIVLASLKAQNIETIRQDLSDISLLKESIKPFDLVVGAVPGFMGFQTLKAVIEAGKNIVDISFFPEDPFELDALAKEKGVTAVVDCGVAPGMSNIILGYHQAQMNVQTYECLVGGLPVTREWPWEYKAVFSPIDVIEEYIRPARYIRNGVLVIKEALSDAELVNFPEIGTLESWNSDGLRTLIRTMPDIPNMIEKTLRYPGSIECLRVLRESGFFSHQDIDIKGVKVKPVDVTAALLFPAWKLKPGEEEYTVMRIIIEGTKNNSDMMYRYELIDRTDNDSKTLSMARTTGYTCTAVANMVLEERFTQKGICPPEYLGQQKENFEFVMSYLATRGVNYAMTSSPS